MPKVSVIMPARNAGTFIDETIDSVLAQDGVDLELLITDDASTDDTRERLQPYGRHPRVYLSFNESSRGAATTRNALIRQARGGYVTPCDADDLMLPGSLQVQAEFLDTHADVGVVYGDTLMVWPTTMAASRSRRRSSAATATAVGICATTWSITAAQ